MRKPRLVVESHTVTAVHLQGRTFPAAYTLQIHYKYLARIFYQQFRIKSAKFEAGVAQSVERVALMLEYLKVVGSSPTFGSIPMVTIKFFC